MIKTIAIIGRSNVGKSTLFNRLIKKREALTSSSPGLTRDRNYSYFSPQENLKYLLIDTGGLITRAQKKIEEKVNMQVEVAIDQADLLLFVVDIKKGLTGIDKELSQKIRRASKPVILVVNKSDSHDKDIMANEFYELGFKEMVVISAIHNRNIYNLVDKIIKIYPDSSTERIVKGKVKLSIAGKPNVGKSTLVNRLAGQERVIVDEKPGTTRNPTKCNIKINNEMWEVIDLAGTWRKRTNKETSEIISMIASRREIERAEVSILILDLTSPLTFQDKRIAGWIVESGTSVVIVGNKKDVIEQKPGIEDSYEFSLYTEMPFIRFAPFVMISAKSGEGIDNMVSVLKKVKENSLRKINSQESNDLIREIVANRPPPKFANKRPKVLGLVQEKIHPTVFSVLIKHPRLDKIPQHWKNYVRNSIYKKLDYYGVPIKINIKKA